MSHNIGNLDRALRAVLGLGLLSLLVLVQSEARWWGMLGLIPLFTAAIGNCPLYSVLGMHTCPAGEQPRFRL